MLAKLITHLLFTIILLFTFSNHLYAEKKTISIRADAWPPYNDQPNSKLPGYMIEIADYAFKKHGYEIDYQLLSWERSLEQVTSGEIDCVVGAYKIDARPFVFHKQSFGEEFVSFYGREDARAWKYEGLDSFKGLTIAVIGGYSYGNEIDFYIANPNNQVHITKGDNALERNIKMLLSKRVDLLLESPNVFEFQSRHIPSAQLIKELDRSSKSESLYFGCTLKKESSQAYVDMLDEGLTELRKTGKLKKILAKYGLSDWETN